MLWTDKAINAGLNKRQIDENQVFNLAATRPDLLTGVDPATGQPAPYGAVGVDINCAVHRLHAPGAQRRTSPPLCRTRSSRPARPKEQPRIPR